MIETGTLPDNFELIVGVMANWSQAWESHVFQHGLPLDDTQTHDASCVGVKFPEKVRILVVPNIPMPHIPVLFSSLVESKLFTPNANGLTLGYGILIRQIPIGMRYWITHELAHVAQYERLGGIELGMRQYLHECFSVGYKQASMEQEAHEAALKCLESDEVARKELFFLFPKPETKEQS